MSNAPVRRLVIVGAGFSGVALAVQLLRQREAEPLEIALIDRAAHGRGVAYAALGFPYLLNVPAGRMSADPLEPHSFLSFAREHLTGPVGAEDYLPRSLYGFYLGRLLQRAERQAAVSRTLLRWRGEVLDLEPRVEDGRWDVVFSSGERLAADAVVLATGNSPPQPLPCLVPWRADERYIADPWLAPGACRAGEEVLIVGTGLTMVDVALCGLRPGGWRRVYALSRHGLLPRMQGTLATSGRTEGVRRRLQSAGTTVRELLRASRRLAHEAPDHGHDWRDVVTELRHLAPGIWAGWGEAQRARFLRHLRAYWEVHRHRVPAQSANQLEEFQQRDHLRVMAGQVVQVEAEGQRLRVSWRPRGATTTAHLTVDRLVNCCGQDFDVARQGQGLWARLRARGLVLADPLGLGLRTGSEGQMLDRHAEPIPNLYYLGPLLRADHWETTAVPELRQRASGLAAALLGNIPARVPGTPEPAAVRRWPPSSRLDAARSRH